MCACATTETASKICVCGHTVTHTSAEFPTSLFLFCAYLPLASLAGLLASCCEALLLLAQADGFVGHVLPLVGLLFSRADLFIPGTGGIKPNVSTMGADQFNDLYSQDRKEKESFFNWFYWSINLGSLISYTLVAYICQYGLPFLGGADWGFFVGYSIPAIFMAMAILIFVMGSGRYRQQSPKGSVLAEAVHVSELCVVCAAVELVLHHTC